MKTRIISGAVMIAILVAALVGASYYPIIITFLLAILNVIASYEMLHNACGIKNKASIIGSSVYSFLAVFALGGYFLSDIVGTPVFTVLTVLYCIFAAIMTLYNHKSFAFKEIVVTLAMPVIISFAFSCLEGTLNHEHGIYYLLLLLNFSNVCDMGAYFVGCSIGKHKLCPQISPKKTIEGAIGGIVTSIIVAVIIVLGFNFKFMLWPTLAVTIPFCILGMVGDLFASAIKRSAGIKDYGTLIPGHGGILDRVDSILMIAPLFYILITAGII